MTLATKFVLFIPYSLLLKIKKLPLAKTIEIQFNTINLFVNSTRIVVIQLESLVYIHLHVLPSKIFSPDSFVFQFQFC